MDESENLILHSVAAVTFFVGYDIFMLVRTVFLAAAWEGEAGGKDKRTVTALAALSVLSSVATCARFAAAPATPGLLWMPVRSRVRSISNDLI